MEHAQLILTIASFLATAFLIYRSFTVKPVSIVSNFSVTATKEDLDALNVEARKLHTDYSPPVKEDYPDPVPANIPAVTVRDEQPFKEVVERVLVVGSKPKKRTSKEIAELEQKILALSKVGLTTKQISVAIFGDRSPADRACVSNTRVVLRRKGMLPKWPHKVKEAK